MEKYEMKKYILLQQDGGYNHAGSKAKTDAVAIARRMGFGTAALPSLLSKKRRLIITRGRRILDPAEQYLVLYLQLMQFAKGSAVLIQYPLDYIAAAPSVVFRLLGRFKRARRLTYIALVHDLNSLRNTSRSTYNEERKYISLFDGLVAHNEVMRGILREDFAYRGMLSTLSVFDYLTDYRIPEGREYTGEVAFAGNLSKAGFCAALGGIPGIRFNLYGPGGDALPDTPNVARLGQWSPEEIVRKVRGAFGLVWDGDDICTCAGSFGEYLRYNSSHKLSLYLVAGLPVIVWRESAVAGYVAKQGIGIAVGSLEELPEALGQISGGEYAAMAGNVRHVAGGLSGGRHLERCLGEMLERLSAQQELRKEA